MAKTKILFTIWFVIAFILIGLLTTIGFMYKKISSEYHKLEDKLIESSEEYLNETLNYPQENLELTITSDDLINAGYLKELKVKKDVCTGYVIITKKDIYEYSAYLKCKNYTTDGYKS